MSLATANAPVVLLIEDEAPMRRFLRNFLVGGGYRFLEACSAEEALQLVAQSPPNLILLDLGLPDMDGQELLRKLREWLTIPIIILSVRDQDLQKISALNQGADDYMTKPFSPGELLARIRVALRRKAQGLGGHEAPVFEAGNLRVDLWARKVFVSEAEVHLTPIEYKLLTTLVHHAGRVVTTQYLLSEVWGSKQSQSRPHLRVHMASLRHKIEADPTRPQHLLTERGVGYRLASE
ncbi:MAG TPA: response regulator [Pirellulales bacterium]|jgi:two-component system KDP operon response regulator KdpE|nr:response regulator [Pirellulales bacterium]